MILGFGEAVAVAILLLIAFAWTFSGRAIRPVEEANRKQIRFVSEASHELRSPLSVIALSVGTMKTAPELQEKMTENIEKEFRRMTRLSATAEHSHVTLSVADSGRGIPDEQKPHVFDRFYRADASRTEKEHYGLGLSIAGKIAELHGAKLSVGDAEIGGAEFSVRINV